MKNGTAIRAIEMALAGEASHRHPAKLLQGLTPEAAGAKPAGASKCIHEILGHLVYWQDITRRWLEGVEPEAPTDPEDAFPEKGSSADAEAWDALVKRLIDGLEKVLTAARTCDLEAPLAGLPDVTAFSCLSTLAACNSYHLGQIVPLRRMAGDWPGSAA